MNCGNCGGDEWREEQHARDYKPERSSVYRVVLVCDTCGEVH